MKLGELAALQVGLPLGRRQNPEGEEYKLLSPKHISPFGEITGYEGFRGRGVEDDFLTRDGDVIMKTAAPNQTLCIKRPEDLGLLIPSSFAIVRLRPEWTGLCLPRFLAVYFNSRAFGAVAERERVSATVKSMKLSTLKELDVPLPPLEQQEKIVAFAALADREQRQLQELLLEKRRYHQQLLLRLLEDRDA